MCDMTLNNELTDVRGLNAPMLESEVVESQDWFNFTDFLPPGYH